MGGRSRLSSQALQCGSALVSVCGACVVWKKLHGHAHFWHMNTDVHISGLCFRAHGSASRQHDTWRLGVIAILAVYIRHSCTSTPHEPPRQNRQHAYSMLLPPPPTHPHLPHPIHANVTCRHLTHTTPPTSTPIHDYHFRFDRRHSLGGRYRSYNGSIFSIRFRLDIMCGSDCL